MTGVLATGTVRAITLYQRHVSPHKGFSCPHRIRHGGQSCSGYVKGLILDSGVRAALPDIRARFDQCREARISLQASHVCEARASSEGSTWRRWRRRIGRPLGRPLDACDCGCEILDCWF